LIAEPAHQLADARKKAGNEANLEMIKQVMAQRFSDMPAARGARERSHL